MVSSKPSLAAATQGFFKLFQAINLDLHCCLFFKFWPFSKGQSKFTVLGKHFPMVHELRIKKLKTSLKQHMLTFLPDTRIASNMFHKLQFPSKQSEGCIINSEISSHICTLKKDN